MSRRSTKGQRHAAILRLLRDRPIASQGDLERALGEEGHRATQSTLSRDLKDLRVARQATDRGYRYLPAADASGGEIPAAMRSVAATEVVQVTANETLVVIRTQVGRASGVAAFLDSRRLDGVLATVAGDDTLVVVPTSVERTIELESALRRLLRRD